jgi:sporulation protein YlmC with PRC-barrel domain
MTWKTHTSLVDRPVRSKDGMVVGTVEELEVDVASWQVKSIKMEASRALLERLQLEGPSVTGGRTVYVDTTDIASVEDDGLHLGLDAIDLARLRWHHTSGGI